MNLETFTRSASQRTVTYGTIVEIPNSPGSNRPGELLLEKTWHSIITDLLDSCIRVRDEGQKGVRAPERGSSRCCCLSTTMSATGDTQILPAQEHNKTPANRQATCLRQLWRGLARAVLPPHTPTRRAGNFAGHQALALRRKLRSMHA